LLTNLEQWDDFVSARYDPNPKTGDFRNYSQTTPGVKEFLPAQS
jgi:hypothetical protein